MMRAWLLATPLFFLPLASAAQVAPFDMSPEKARPTDGSTKPGQGSVQLEPIPQAAVQPKVTAVPGTPLLTAAPSVQNKARYLIPGPKLTLTGEMDRRAWSISLTPEQAASNAEFHLAYQNSIVTAPELSVLRVKVNDTVVLEEQIQSAEAARELSVTVPAGLLKAGENSIAFTAVMRHRTDCTISSTYELWTEIKSARTFLSFSNVDAGSLRRLDDLAAIGVDAAGSTEFQIIAPAVESTTAVGPVVRLAEALAITANMPNQVISIRRQPEVGGPGELVVVVGIPSEISNILTEVPSGAEVSPIVTFVNDPKTGPSTLVVSGPTWPSISSAIESIIRPVDREPQTLRPVMPTRSWRIPDAPIVRGGDAITFAQLGATTEEFSGRRFRTDFVFGIPADFYAGDYGEVTLNLDAAYSSEVLAGSHIDIYVNDNIAATVPITQSGGDILRQLPVRVTMRHFRPGVNTLALEANLITETDKVCVPGAPGNPAPRFALFDTSQFFVPDYARVARTPDLAAFAGTGFPYSRTPKPVVLVIPRAESAIVSAAATVMAQMSVAAGRAIPVEATLSQTSVSDRDAVFVTDVARATETTLSQFGIGEQTKTAWAPGAVDTSETASIATTDATFDRWRDELSEGSWFGGVGSIDKWLQERFGLTLSALRLSPYSQDEAFVPSVDDRLVVAQQASPSGTATWTIFTAPTTAALDQGVRLLGTRPVWNRIDGRITALGVGESRMNALPIGNFRFLETQPPSVANYRLVIANWLSANGLGFSAALTALCILLGLSTKLLLSLLGRPK